MITSAVCTASQLERRRRSKKVRKFFRLSWKKPGLNMRCLTLSSTGGEKELARNGSCEIITQRSRVASDVKIADVPVALDPLAVLGVRCDRNPVSVLHQLER